MLKSVSFTHPESKVAAYFEVGDIILFGKYKNKRGKIVGFGKDDKGQPTVEIEPIPKGQKKNQTLTLFKVRKAPAEKTASCVASRFIEAERVTRQKGTCALCWRLQKIPNGLLANHGYNRPGYGYIQGQCPGSRHAPWEVSKVTGELAQDMLTTRVGLTTNALRELRTTDTLYIPGVGSFEKDRTIRKSEVKESRWNQLLEGRQKRLERDLHSYQQALEEYRTKLSSWKAQEITEIDEAKIELDKREKRTEVYGKRMDRYKSLLQKALDRLDHTWSNLKQREVKAKTKPVAKNFIDVAKAANVLYDIYGGTTSKLAEAHPDPAYKNLDVLKDLDRDKIWKHLGTMQGPLYLDPRKSKDVQEYTTHTRMAAHGWGFPSLNDYSKDPDVSKDWRPSWPGFKPKTASQVVTRCQNYLWNTPNMTTAVASRIAIRSRVAVRYVLAYAERETKLLMKAHEAFKNTASKLMESHTKYVRARKKSKEKARLAEEVKGHLEYALKFAKVNIEGIDAFMQSYKPMTEDKESDFKDLQSQWKSWRRDPDAFVNSAEKYLAKGNPEDYDWPVIAVKEAVNILSTISYGALQLGSLELKEPEVHDKANMADTLREFAKGKPVGLARQVVKNLGKDKNKVFSFVFELLEDVNLATLARTMKVPLKGWLEDEDATKEADSIGRKISWNSYFAVGIAYSALKTVGEMPIGEKLLAEAAGFFENFPR